MISTISFSNLQDELSNNIYKLIPEVNRYIISAIEDKKASIDIPINVLTINRKEVKFIKKKLIEADYIINESSGKIHIDLPKKVKIACSFDEYFKLSNIKLIPSKYVLVSNKVSSKFIKLFVDSFFTFFNKKLNLTIEKFVENNKKPYNFEICLSDVFEQISNYKSETLIVKKFIKDCKNVNSNKILPIQLYDVFKLVHPLIIIKIKEHFKSLEYPFSEQIKLDQTEFTFILNSSDTLILNNEED